VRLTVRAVAMRAACGLLAVMAVSAVFATDARAARAPGPRTDADAAILNAIVKRVDDHYNHLMSLRSQFTERYTGLGMDRSESGTLLLKKPGRMRWSYTTPAGKVFVLDGKYAWAYTPGDAQVQRIPAKQVDDLRSPLRFLLGHTQLKKELDGLAVVPERDGYRISGIPKGMGERFKQLVLKTAADGRITAIRMEEIDGSSTEFGFSGSEENVALPDSEFRYLPPPGLAVVEGLPPV